MGQATLSNSMACPCANKKKQGRPAPAIVDDGRVPLGFADDVPLPMLFEGVYKGFDVVVLAHANAPYSKRQGRDTILVPGRNAKVAPELRQAIAAQFPNMFTELRQLSFEGRPVTVIG